MATFLWKGGRFVSKATGEPMPMPERDAICAPMVMGDIPEYVSPVGSGVITSRSHRREDLKRHGCEEAPPRKNRGYRNPQFALKRGLPLNDEARAKLEKEAP